MKLVVDREEKGQINNDNNNVVDPVAIESRRDNHNNNNSTSNRHNNNDETTKRSKFEVLVEDILGAASNYRAPYDHIVMRERTRRVSSLANVVIGACIDKKALGDNNMKYLRKIVQLTADCKLLLDMIKDRIKRILKIDILLANNKKYFLISTYSNIYFSSLSFYPVIVAYHLSYYKKMCQDSRKKYSWVIKRLIVF